MSPVSLLRPEKKLPASPQEGWLDLTLPLLLIQEAARVDWA
jgi:hypothetical protein